MKILAIESSCDETACAIVEDGIKIISNVVASSKKLHHKYGGIMPELAAREQLSSILPVIQEALKILPQEKMLLKLFQNISTQSRLLLAQDSLEASWLA